MPIPEVRSTTEEALCADPASNGTIAIDGKTVRASRSGGKRALSAEELAAAVRAHWGVENRLHWVLDVSFSEDASTLRKVHAPQNLSLLRKLALNSIRADKIDKSKASHRLKRKGAAWDDAARAHMLELRSICQTSADAVAAPQRRASGSFNTNFEIDDD